jgi:hypothetical protein
MVALKPLQKADPQLYQKVLKIFVTCGMRGNAFGGREGCVYGCSSETSGGPVRHRNCADRLWEDRGGGDGIGRVSASVNLDLDEVIRNLEVLIFSPGTCSELEQ